MKKDDIFLFLDNRIKAGVTFQSGGNGKFSGDSIPWRN